MVIDIRYTIRADMPAVLAIDSDSYAPPWTEDEFLRRLRDRAYIGKVAEVDGRVGGFMLYVLHRDRVELIRLAVAPDCRRRGICRRFAAGLAEKLSTPGRDRITAVVPDDLVAAHLALKSCGFLATAIVPDLGRIGRDAYAFSYRPRVPEPART